MEFCAKYYELVFELYALQEEQLELISSDDNPEKAFYYVNYANVYYFFQDYEKAIYYYYLAMKEPDNNNNYYSKLHALNGLAISYSGKGDYNRSDSCLHIILQLDFIVGIKRDEWEGIVEGHLGNNMISRHEIEKAIPLLKSSVEKMLKFNDYAFASGRASDLVKVLIEMGNIEETGYYMEFATENHFKPRYPRNSHVYYEAKCKYYLAFGEEALSRVYLDSIMTAKQQRDEQFNTLLLLRLEQKESAKQQRRLVDEKIRNRNYFLFALGGCAFLLIV